MTEDLLQTQMVAYHNDKYRQKSILVHIANERMTTPQHANKLKAMGVIAGVPDLLLTWDGGYQWIEVKTPTGTLSPKQKDFARRAAMTTNQDVALVRSMPDFIAVLERVLGPPN
jgi:hypothetical protein